jgi:hypothetical protein
MAGRNRAVTEAIQRQPAGTRLRQVKDAVLARRGNEAGNTAKVAAARELLCEASSRCATAAPAALPSPGRPHNLPVTPGPGARPPSMCRRRMPGHRLPGAVAPL